MRRNVGLSSLSRRDDTLASYQSLSSTISTSQIEILTYQLNTFQTALRTFATKYRTKILKDAKFREEFLKMCQELSVDPLGSGLGPSGANNRLWNFLGLNEYIFILAIQIIDICLIFKERNGGLIELQEVLRLVKRLREGDQPALEIRNSSVNTITENDIVKAIKVLEPLGCGYSIILIHGTKFIRFVPQEFDLDSLIILECATALLQPKLTNEDLADFTQRREMKPWSSERIGAALDKALLIEGLIWIDNQTETGIPEYWIPALIDFEP